MSLYVARRLAAVIPTLIAVGTVVFILVRLLPGDPAVVIAGLFATEEEVGRIRHQLGLDQPALVQYALFMSRLALGDLGTSVRTGQPVTAEVLARLPYTSELAFVAMTIATAVGVVAGVLAAVHHNSPFDYGLSTLTLLGVSMPVYWLGIMLIIVFAVNLHWLPAAGAERPESLVLPSLTLASVSVALIARMTRSSMLEVLRQDYVRTARSKGLHENAVRYNHALRNSLLPVMTVVGLQFGNLLGGAVLTETVFGWPGMGQLMVDSIFARDYPVVQGVVLIISTLFIVVNLIVDLSYAYIDPQIRYQ